MLDAIIWGLTQGLTEFLPVSSSGHLVLVPALLGRPSPDLATAAFLHVGTLVAALIYFRVDVGQMLKLTQDGRKMLKLVVIGTIPATVIGLLFRGALGRFVESPRAVAVSMLLLGIGLLSTRFITARERKVADLRVPDAAAIGLAQAVALIPGVSRSGTTIAAAMMRGVDKSEAARFSFLLGIPAIAGAGLIETIDLASTDAGITLTMVVGVLVAGVSGYFAIAGLLSLIRRAGLVPFGAYCVGFATLSLIVL